MLIARRLKEHAEGPYDDPQTWRAVALALGIEVYDFYQPRGGRGEYAATVDRGAIAINTYYPGREQCSAWVHEIAHHFLTIWIPPQLPGAADTYCYSDDVKDMRHRIACLTERFVFGF